jgi:acyl-CoA thioesterase FadM
VIAPSLADMERSGHVRTEGPDLLVRVPADWPAAGEKRIGYVTIMRLAELTRELHWRRDVEPLADRWRIDSVTKSVTGDFSRPILADTSVRCSYTLAWVRTRSYGLRVDLSGESGEQLAYIDLTSVFIDPATMRPVVPAPPVAEALKKWVVPGRPAAGPGPVTRSRSAG